MKPERDTKEYFEKWKGMKLSASSRARMEKELLEYARFHAVSEGATGRLREQVPHGTSLFTRFSNFHVRPMPVLALVITLVVTGGTAFAAQGSLPGDLLYPVKTELNENVRSALALSSESEARLQAKLLDERIEEAAALEADGRLNGELAVALQERIEAHAVAAEQASEQAEASFAVSTSDRIRIALERFSALTGNQLAVRSESSMAMKASEEGVTMDAFGTSELALEPVSVSELLASTEARLESLKEVVAEHEESLRADVRTEASVVLESAAERLVEARTAVETGAEAAARDSITMTGQMLGEVEAALSLLGEIEIDPETGFIIDIDLSRPPAADPFRSEPVDPDPVIDIQIEDSGAMIETEVRTRSEGGTSESSVHQTIEGSSDSSVLINGAEVQLESETSVESSSGLNL